MKVKKEKGWSFNGGILIIGSLLWDEDNLRETWRVQALNLPDAVLIDAPIRYGRISKERNCTFSMVFSKECAVADKLGKGVFVPFQGMLEDFSALEVQALELIKAEKKNNDLKHNRFNWDWGCLAILVNPELLDHTSEKYHEGKLLLTNWAAKYGTGFDPNQYKIGDENPIVNKQGILQFSWPENLKGIDFLICTTTKPNVTVYPGPKNIADRITVNDYSEYFIKNREGKISTFQDDEIIGFLKNIEDAG